MDGFTVYKDYIGLKLHFNEWNFVWKKNFNYKKFSISSFEKRNDKKLFASLLKKIPDRDERIEIMITNFLQNKKAWIGDMIDDSFNDLHRKRMIRVRSLLHVLEEDCEKIIDFINDMSISFKEILLTDENFPFIIKNKHRIGGISDETLAVFSKFFKFTSQKTDNILWEEERLRLHKYSYFLDIENIEKVKKIFNQLLAQPSASAQRA